MYEDLNSTADLYNVPLFDSFLPYEKIWLFAINHIVIRKIQSWIQK